MIKFTVMLQVKNPDEGTMDWFLIREFEWSCKPAIGDELIVSGWQQVVVTNVWHHLNKGKIDILCECYLHQLCGAIIASPDSWKVLDHEDRGCFLKDEREVREKLENLLNINGLSINLAREYQFNFVHEED